MAGEEIGIDDAAWIGACPKEPSVIWRARIEQGSATSMITMGRRFARKAPSKADKNRFVDIRMTDMVANDAAWWDARLGRKHAFIQSRADRFWSWSVLLPVCHLIQLAKRRHCRPLVIWARDDANRFLRVGMSISIGHRKIAEGRQTQE